MLIHLIFDTFIVKGIDFFQSKICKYTIVCEQKQSVQHIWADLTRNIFFMWYCMFVMMLL